MERDLKIALAEYAPGAEVIRGKFPNTYIYQSVGVYDRYNANPHYHPSGALIECADCQSIMLVDNIEDAPDQCAECGSFFVMALPYVRVRRGKLFTCNKGPNPDFPGFIICPVCGRALDPDNPGSHRYPASVPPFSGRNIGPRAGDWCSNTTDFRNQVILGHQFVSEVILLGVDLPATMDAPLQQPSGRAAWYSFGVLVANAAAIILQIDPGELKVGVRAVRRGLDHRLHGEVFIYDDVPGGAGYARAIEQNMQVILEKALELGEQCANPDCGGACYHCMFDYRNQA